MAFTKKFKPRKEPYLSPSDIKRIAEMEDGGKYAKFKAFHYRITFVSTKYPPIESSMYGQSKEEIIEKAKATLNVLNSKEKTWKIADAVNLKEIKNDE